MHSLFPFFSSLWLETRNIEESMQVQWENETKSLLVWLPLLMLFFSGFCPYWKCLFLLQIVCDIDLMIFKNWGENKKKCFIVIVKGWQKYINITSYSKYQLNIKTWDADFSQNKQMNVGEAEKEIGVCIGDWC